MSSLGFWPGRSIRARGSCSCRHCKSLLFSFYWFHNFTPRIPTHFKSVLVARVVCFKDSKGKSAGLTSTWPTHILLAAELFSPTQSLHRTQCGALAWCSRKGNELIRLFCCVCSPLTSLKRACGSLHLFTAWLIWRRRSPFNSLNVYQLRNKYLTLWATSGRIHGSSPVLCVSQELEF